MKIATWNLLSSNKTQFDCIKLLIKLKVNIACLQEVRKETLTKAKKLGFSVNHFLSHRHRRQQMYAVILSDSKPTKLTIKKFNYPASHTALASMARLDYSMSGYQFCDFKFSSHHLRVFNFHLPYSSSAEERIKLFKQGLKSLSKGNNVICGDFNSFGHFPWNLILDPFNEAGFSSWKFNELKELEKLCKKYTLHFCKEAPITYPLCQTHIDHIFIPKLWKKFRYSTIPAQCGSDHNLVILETNDL